MNTDSKFLEFIFSCVCGIELVITILCFTPGNKCIEKFHQIKFLKFCEIFEIEILYITSVNDKSETVYIYKGPIKSSILLT